MSNSIWKTPYQNPENYQSIMFITKNKSTRAGVFKDGFYYDDANNQYEDDELECWATIYDVKAQADKAERLQKAVDLAVGALKKINETYEEEYYKGDDEHDSCDWLNCADDMDDLATDAIDEIRQLIKEK